MVDSHDRYVKNEGFNPADPHYEQIEASFIRTLDADLDYKIKLEALPFESNIFSPTPGDPFSIELTNGETYYDQALELMLGRFRDHAKATNIDDVARKEIEDEIETFHMNRCVKNSEGYSRGRKAIGDNLHLLTKQQRADFLDLRVGAITPSGAVRLLADFPAMGSVGIGQYTSPLDNIGLLHAAAIQADHFTQSLDEAGIPSLLVDRKWNYKTPIANDQDTSAVPAHYQHINSLEELFNALPVTARPRPAVSNFYIAKRVLREIEWNGVEMELVESINPRVFPLNPKLTGVPENRVELPNGMVVNLQGNSNQTYLRIKQEWSPPVDQMYFAKPTRGLGETAFGSMGIKKDTA